VTVKAKTEELLYMLLCAAEMAMRPTLRNMTESFEAWAYRRGFHQQLAALEKARLVVPDGPRIESRIYRLTDAGRLRALGGCDPMARWNRAWDGKWRMALFDVPQIKASVRDRLRRALKARGFGYLQNSVWITPDPLLDEREKLGSSDVDVESLILFDARPCAGESNTEIVAGAWDFNFINQCYRDHAAVMNSLPRRFSDDSSGASRLHRWLREERLAWMKVLKNDPFLPDVLHPPGYLGKKAWKRRLKLMKAAGRLMRTFNPNSLPL